jgi:hypothetical protein
MLAVLSGCGSGSNSSSAPFLQLPLGTHGGLTDREFSVATRVAQHEADAETTVSLTSATATVTHGTVWGNTEHRCSSGTLLNISVIGDFTINYFETPGGHHGPVHAVLLTADPESGQVCLITVETGHVTPQTGSTVLPARRRLLRQHPRSPGI